MDFDLLQNAAVDFLSWVKDDLDPLTTRKGQISKTGTGAVLETPAHVHFAKYGRDKGKPPPFINILDWVQRKNILFDGLDEEGTAKVIVWKIARKGTNNFKKGAPNALEESLGKSYGLFADKLVESMSIAFDDDLNYLTAKPVKLLEKFKV